jgi:hypothetical protein
MVPKTFELLRHMTSSDRSPGAYPTKSFKYWFTNICNYKYVCETYTVYIFVNMYQHFHVGKVFFAKILSQFL